MFGGWTGKGIDPRFDNILDRGRDETIQQGLHLSVCDNIYWIRDW
jgi:hypothetical protein